MWLSRIALASIATMIASLGAYGQQARTLSPEEAVVYIISPEDGATVTSPFTVRFGLKGMGVAPAGTEVANTGHHHLLVDVDELPAIDRPIPADEHHRHFGGGQTEVELELEPGKHTLQLFLGDRFHVPHEPPVVSERITITVE
jgi:hypothetical protein